jgi:uncharacterized protein (DUF488 family)
VFATDQSLPPAVRFHSWDTVRIFTLGHGARSENEFVETLREADVRTLVDVRRFPGSRRHPQFNRDALALALEQAGIDYRHAVELGGRRSGEPGEERFGCLRVAAFRSYAARMATEPFQTALERALAEPVPCFMCAETLWWRCHRRLIAELLTARGHELVHLLGPRQRQPHRLYDESEVVEGKLYICGSPVA